MLCPERPQDLRIALLPQLFVGLRGLLAQVDLYISEPCQQP